MSLSNFIQKKQPHTFFSQFFLVAKRMRSGKIRKITGLDPNYALYPIGDLSKRLNKNDAHYVETIQTSTLKGYKEPIGHVRYVDVRTLLVCNLIQIPQLHLFHQ